MSKSAPSTETSVTKLQRPPALAAIDTSEICRNSAAVSEPAQADQIPLESFRRVMDPALASPARSNFEMVQAIEAPDAHSVIFRLSAPYGGFADILPSVAILVVEDQSLDRCPLLASRHAKRDRIVRVGNTGTGNGHTWIQWRELIFTESKGNIVRGAENTI